MIEKISSIVLSTLVRITMLFQEKDYSTWVFSSSYNKKFNYNSRYLFEYVLENEKHITPLFVINDDKLRGKLQLYYGEKFFTDSLSIKGMKRILKSGVWFTSAGLPIYGFKLNRKRLIINLWHGVPLKKIALLENKISIIKKMYFKFIFSNNYSYIITTSKNLINIMAKSFDVKKEKVEVLGQPRNDLLFERNNRNQILNNLYIELPHYNKTILYAPTFREYGNTKLFPFEDFDINELNNFLYEKKIILFIRLHQSEIANIDLFKKSERIFFINEDKIADIMKILNIFDLLITDYSSIYIDFLLLERPMIFLPYDKNEYFYKRGFNFDYDEVTPGPRTDNLEGFKKEISLLLDNENYYHKERENVNLFFNEIVHGNSRKIVNFVKNAKR